MKQVQVVWSTEALDDLETIYDFLAAKSRQAAQRIVENILFRIKQIETFPESGARQVTLKINDKEYRYLVEGNYKIIYSYDDDSHAAYIKIIFDTRFNPDKLKV